MSDQVCLKWNSFLHNIASSFESFWEEEGCLVDVTLASDGQCLNAHKIILSASSPFFKKVFQTNPCSHPVIILQDVRFVELRALLTFIYKGEVNVDQENLPALLKAAETLQIRGLCRGDVPVNESHKRLLESENIDSNDLILRRNSTSRKKHKMCQLSNDGTFDKIVTSQLQNKETTDCNISDRIYLDLESRIPDDSVGSKCNDIQLKVEDCRVDLQGTENNTVNHTDLQRFDGINHRVNTIQRCSDGDTPTEDTTGIPPLSYFSDVKPQVIYPYQQLPYAELLPTHDVISTWASNRPIDHLACDLMKRLFTTEERILCNVNGKMGKKQFDSNKIHLIREVLIHFSGIEPNSVEWEETWKNCVIKIDTSNRGFKRYLNNRLKFTNQNFNSD